MLKAFFFACRRKIKPIRFDFGCISEVLSGFISLEHVKLQTIHDCVIRDGRECLITANLIYTKRKKKVKITVI